MKISLVRTKKRSPIRMWLCRDVKHVSIRLKWWLDQYNLNFTIITSYQLSKYILLPACIFRLACPAIEVTINSYLCPDVYIRPDSISFYVLGQNGLTSCAIKRELFAHRYLPPLLYSIKQYNKLVEA